MAIGIGGRSNTGRGTAPNAPRHRNRAPNRARTTFKCGHRGLGLFCHRCEQAKVLKDRAAAGQKVSWNHEPRPRGEDRLKIVEKASLVEVKAMFVEADRLLAPAKPKSKKT